MPGDSLLSHSLSSPWFYTGKVPREWSALYIGSVTIDGRVGGRVNSSLLLGGGEGWVSHTVCALLIESRRGHLAKLLPLTKKGSLGNVDRFSCVSVFICNRIAVSS